MASHFVSDLMSSEKLQLQTEASGGIFSFTVIARRTAGQTKQSTHVDALITKVEERRIHFFRLHHQ